MNQTIVRVDRIHPALRALVVQAVDTVGKGGKQRKKLQKIGDIPV
jgi:hypothetical protein